MNKSLIEWCDFTWNPVTGCQHGCLYCYAAKQANRFSGNVLINKTSEQLRKEWDERGTRWVLEKPFKNEIGKVTPFPVKFEPMFREYCLPMPAQKKKPAVIFVVSMGDLFGEWVPDEWIRRVFGAAQAAPWHTYLFLTKNPQRYMNIWDTDDPDMVAIRAGMEAIVKNVRRDSTEGLALPNGWQFQLLSTGGRRQFDTNAIIERYDTRMAMTVLADFIFLGHQSVGSFALSSDKTELFSMAIGAYLDIICEVFNNQAIPRLINLNGDHFNGITDYPRMEHGDIEDEDIEKLANYIKEMTGVGILTPDSQLEDYVREAAHLPERLEDDTPAVPDPGGEKPVNARQRQQAKPQQQRSSAVDPGGGEEDPDGVTEEDMQAVEEARKRLGRDP